MTADISKSRLQKLLSYQQKKKRKRKNLFPIEGVRLVLEALQSDWEVGELYYSHSFKLTPSGNRILELARKRRVELLEVQEKVIRKMADTEKPQGVVAMVNMKHFSAEQTISSGRTDFVLALEDIRDPGNLGTLIRSADALGCDAVLLSENSVELYNPKVLRSNMGSLFHLPVIYPIKLLGALESLKQKKFRLVATSPSGGKNCNEVDFREPTCLLVGNEARGLTKEILELCDQRVTIPRWGKAESLNVSVAAGIIMYEIAQQKKSKPGTRVNVE